jgi:hypothetical protein
MPNIEIEMVQPVALVSVSMSALVVLTAIIFPQMIYRRIFMQLIVSISAADILGNWTYCLGSNPPGHSFLCAFEGFCNLFFFPVGWILTMFLTLLFRDLLTKGKIFYSRPLIFGASLLVPLFFTLLYLAFTQYTTDDDEGLHPCTFGSGAQLYHQITYDGMIGVCLIVMFGLMVATFKYEYDNPARAKLQTYKLVRKIITLYPIALIVCWAPHSICIVFQRKPEYRRLLDHLMKQYVEPNLFFDEQKRIFMCQLQYAPPKGLMFDLFVPIEWLQANVSSANDSGAESVISYIDLDDENAITGEIGKLLKIFSDLHAVDGRQIYLNQLVQQLKNSMRERGLTQ